MIKLSAKLAAAAVLLVVCAASAQTPFLVSDIGSTRSPSPQGSYPDGYVAVGNSVYFSATAADVGSELWKYSDGSATLVADIEPGSGSSGPRSITPLRDDLLFFIATTTTQGAELWATDGTARGTRIVKDINPGTTGKPIIQTVANGRLFFNIDDGVHGNEVWVSDGTEAGTFLLIDADGASTSSGVHFVTPFGADRALIFAGGGMWSSDGTVAGTTSILPLQTLGTSTTTTVAAPLWVGSTLYFTANAVAGRELWKTDGTAAGTLRVKDICPGPNGGVTETKLAALGSSVFFFGSESGTSYELWRSDGTDAGTVRVAADLVDPSSTFGGLDLIASGSLVYVASNRGLWRSDGTSGGTYLVDTNRAIGPVAAFGEAYYFLRTTSGYELWASGGTGATTRRLRAFEGANSNLSATRFAGGKLYVPGRDELHGTEPWVTSDGTNVVLLVNINPDPPASSWPADLTAVGSTLFFSANDGTGQALWRSDGTSAGTTSLSSFMRLSDSSASPFASWNGALYFMHDAAHLWRTDGTVAGTIPFREFLLNSSSSVVLRFWPDNVLYFVLSEAGSTLWRTDGTEAGTFALVSDDEVQSARYPTGLAAMIGRLYFGRSGDDGFLVTEGTVPSTRRISNIRPGPLQSAMGRLFFARSTNDEGNELWMSDGTLEGTKLVKDIVAGTGSSTPQQLAGSARLLFFVADDGVHGNEVWRSDGTAAGTYLLRDVDAGATSSGPRDLKVVGDTLYFVADDGISGAELWRSDGTVAGTVMVSDLRPGASSSNPRNLSPSDGTLWFSADDGVHGTELWRTTAGGVEIVADLEPGSGSSNPGPAVRAGALLYFSATTSAGNELWALDLSPLPTIAVNDVRVTEGNSGTTTAAFLVTRSGDTSGTSSVTWSTSDLSATAGSDFVGGGGTIVFAAGETAKSIDVLVNGDTSIEDNESFLVSLSSVSGALISRSSAVAVIEEDDRAVDLAVDYSPDSPYGIVTITNQGPSIATDIQLTLSVSPGATAFSGPCRGGNPVRCNVGSLEPGATIRLQTNEGYAEMYVDPAAPAGRTVTADVRASEIERNSSDNIVTRMYGAGLELPPYLTNGVGSTATYRANDNNVMLTVTSSTPSVTVSPSSMSIAVGSAGHFTVTPSNFVGRLRLTTSDGSNSHSVPIASVQPGTLPKLDVGVGVRAPAAVYGDPVNIVSEILARRHDGTRPTGSVTLFDSAGAVLLQQALSADAATTFSKSGLAPGRYDWTLSYSGDANFNPIENVPVGVTVNSIPTTTVVEVPAYFCGTADVIVRVRNNSTTDAPDGTVTLKVSAETVATLTLSPSGKPGESVATLHRTFAPSETYVSAFYNPASSTFASSSAGSNTQPVTCAPFNFVAIGSGTTVAMSWAAQPGAHHYDVSRRQPNSNWWSIATTASTSFTDAGLNPDQEVLYAVRALDSAGNVLAYSAPELATTFVFTDDPLVVRSHYVRAAHLTELQNATNSLAQIAVYWSAVEFPAAIVGGTVRAARIVELRDAINYYRQRLGLSTVSFTDPSLAPGDRIKAVHIQELRSALK